MKYFPMLFLSVGILTLHAQSSSTNSTRNQFWGAVVVNYKLTPVWTSITDIQYRVNLSDGDVLNDGIRSGIFYQSKCGIQYGVGGAFLLIYPHPNGKVPRQEIRPWEDVSYKWEFSEHHVLNPKIRLEQRFIREYEGTELADAFTLSTHRLRIRTDYTYKIGLFEQRWTILAGEEYMINRKPDGFTVFDQNRAWAGIGFKVNRSIALQLLYMNLYLRGSSGVSTMFNVIRLNLQFAFTTKAAQPPVK